MAVEEGKFMGKDLLETALAYGQLRWKIHPCHGFDSKMSCTCGKGHKEPKDAGKHPALPMKWNELSSSDEYDIKKWWAQPEPGKKYSKNEFIPNPNYNIALHCSKSGFFVIDVDPRSGGNKSYEKLIQLLDEKGLNLPETVEAITGEYSMGGEPVRGRHIYFKCGTGESLVGNLENLGMPGIDIKYHGYVMLPPSKHFSGAHYEWFEGRDPWSIEIAQAPEELLNLIRKPRSYKPNAMGNINWGELEEQADKLDLKKMYKEGIKEGERNVKAYRMAVVLAYRVAPPSGEIDEVLEEIIVAAMIDYNRKHINPPLEEEGSGGLVYQVRRAINFVRDNPATYIDPSFQDWLDRQSIIALDPEQAAKYLPDVSPNEPAVSQHTRTLIYKAVEEGKSIWEAVSRDNIDYPDDPDAVETRDGGVPGRRSLTDLGNSRRLVDNYGVAIAYTPDLGFKIWEDGYWKTDKESLYVQELAKKIPAAIQSEIYELSQNGEDTKPHERWQKASRGSGRIRAAIDGSKSDPRIHVDISDWDKDPLLFGAANGVINLKTGELMNNAPSSHISMRSPIQYIPGYRNDAWQRFLDDSTDGDREYQKFLQRAVGYSMTGLSNLDVIFLMYGPPGTGKNTFIESVVKALGEYSWPLDLSVISPTSGMTSNSDLYHIAELFNKRLSWVDELPEGERLKENTMKKLSGSSLMSARSPGGRPFSFYLKAKIWISSNHRPPISDEAMWRRLVALPFVHAPKTIDPHLKEYLSDPERGQPAVLAWAVEGAVDYIKNPHPGINPIGYSKVVHDSTELYKKGEDRIGLFISEELREESGIFIPFQTVYHKYRAWSMDQGDSYITMASFEKKFLDKGIKLEGTGTNAKLEGYTLKNQSTPTSYGAPPTGSGFRVGQKIELTSEL